MNQYIIERTSKDGKYITYKVQVPYYKNGKRCFLTESFSSKKYGSKKLALEQAKKTRDKFRYHAGVEGITGVDVTIQEVLEKKFELFPTSKETERKHRIYFKANIEPFVASLTFNDIKSADIQKSLNSMVKSCSTDTINRVFSIWKQLYRTAIMHDITAIDQTIKVIVPQGEKIEKHREATTTKETLEEICESLLKSNRVNKEIIIDALWVMYYTGMRPNEVYALDKENINQEKKTITIVQSVGSNSTEDNVIKRTKNTNSVRVIPYPPQLDEIFNKYNGMLFIKKDGGLLNGSYVSNILRSISKGTFRAYQLRHQFATDLLKKGVDLKTIQTMMGHQNGSMTLSYARTDFDSMVDALNKRD